MEKKSAKGRIHQAVLPTQTTDNLTLTPTRDTINEKHEGASGKETSDQANIHPYQHTPNNENYEHHGTNITGPKVYKSYYEVITAAPDTVSR